MKCFAAIATVATIAALSSSGALSQTPAGSTAAVGMKSSAESPQGGKNKAGSGKGMRSREHADARECLRFPTNLEIIKCAEKYRNR